VPAGTVWRPLRVVGEPETVVCSVQTRVSGYLWSVNANGDFGGGTSSVRGRVRAGAGQTHTEEAGLAVGALNSNSTLPDFLFLAADTRGGTKQLLYRNAFDMSTTGYFA